MLHGAVLDGTAVLYCTVPNTTWEDRMKERQAKAPATALSVRLAGCSLARLACRHPEGLSSRDFVPRLSALKASRRPSHFQPSATGPSQASDHPPPEAVLLLWDLG